MSSVGSLKRSYKRCGCYTYRIREETAGGEGQGEDRVRTRMVMVSGLKGDMRERGAYLEWTWQELE